MHVGRNGGVRLQIQAYNLFNQVEFTSLNASMRFQHGSAGFVQTSNTAGTQSSVINPRAIGLTLRMDF
jgi:outer membrane receptor protein involved in Fe transport